MGGRGKHGPGSSEHPEPPDQYEPLHGQDPIPSFSVIQGSLPSSCHYSFLLIHHTLSPTPH